MIALAGEAMERCGKRAPLSLLRYKAMTEDYLTPIDRTIELTGPAPYTMEQGLDETFRWWSNRSQAAAPTQATQPTGDFETAHQPEVMVSAR